MCDNVPRSHGSSFLKTKLNNYSVWYEFNDGSALRVFGAQYITANSF